MKCRSESFPCGGRIPEKFGYGRPGPDGRTVPSENFNPHLAWSDLPEGTKSLCVLCLDDSVPTDLAGRLPDGTLPVWQPRRRFVHWLQADIDPSVTEIPEGALSNERKLAPGYGVPGTNDYSRGKAVEPGATGSGYDGPCPPAFDARWHEYRFMVVALDAVAGFKPGFAYEELEAFLAGHALASCEWPGSYSLNAGLLA